MSSENLSHKVLKGACHQNAMAQKEVEQLNLLKASKMNEIVLKKQDELEEIYRGVHMDIESEAERQILMDLIDSGNVDLSDLLAGMDSRIAKAKEQAINSKVILEKVEKWKFASEEESWLDEYERDQNCYSADSVHKNMKRAEKAIILDQKKLQEQNLAEKETL